MWRVDANGSVPSRKSVEPDRRTSLELGAPNEGRTGSISELDDRVAACVFKTKAD